MGPAYSIVVPDKDLLSRLCGTNDSNLDLIEKYLGVPVYAQGNELSVPDDNPDVTRQFHAIIDRLIDEANAGFDVNPEMLSSILQFPDEQNFDSLSISIPGSSKKVYPKSKNQAELIKSMRQNDMVFCTGPAGSGKTFLMVAEALRLLLSHEKKTIILSRPIVEAGESLGYLPGDLEQKINPYLRPLFDGINSLLPSTTVRKLIDLGAIETAPLAYMRGRTLNNCVAVLDEAQNTTQEQMKMFLTRMGEGSKIFITGDMTQIDLPKKNQSGLIHAVQILKSIPEISIINFNSKDVVRNPLVRKIVKAYENE
ncbi:MAG: PhoH family protein [Spirochaetaceae bacterium]|nr:PhoH family protein [Spirochaetaceae bacterium]